MFINPTFSLFFVRDLFWMSRKSLPLFTELLLWHEFLGVFFFFLWFGRKHETNKIGMGECEEDPPLDFLLNSLVPVIVVFGSPRLIMEKVPSLLEVSQKRKLTALNADTSSGLGLSQISSPKHSFIMPLKVFFTPPSFSLEHQMCPIIMFWLVDEAICDLNGPRLELFTLFGQCHLTFLKNRLEAQKWSLRSQEQDPPINLKCPEQMKTEIVDFFKRGLGRQTNSSRRELDQTFFYFSRGTFSHSVRTLLAMVIDCQSKETETATSIQNEFSGQFIFYK